MYAASIVHEATHGYLKAKGIKTTEGNKTKIERICTVEENRFLSRIDSQWGEQLQKPFNPCNWECGSFKQQFFEVRRRLKEEKQKT